MMPLIITLIFAAADAAAADITPRLLHAMPDFRFSLLPPLSDFRHTPAPR